MRNKKFIYVIGAALLLLAVVIGVWTGVPENASAAPNAVITPVAYTSSGGDGGVAIFEWAHARVLTADTTVCKDLRLYKAADLQWVIDQGTVNTTTITMRITVDRVNQVDEATLVSANVADVSAIREVPLHGVYTCMFFDLANSNPITITLVGKAMK